MLNNARFSSFAALFALIMLAGAGVVSAQDQLYVTGVSSPGAAWLEDADGARIGLGTRLDDAGEIDEGVIRVASDHQIMLFSESGAALILIGPAKMTCRPDNAGLTLVLDDGRLIVAADRPSGGVRLPIIAAPEDSQGTPAFEAVLAPGIAYFQRIGLGLGVAFKSEPGETDSMKLDMLGQPRSIANGEMILFEGGDMRTGSATAWLSGAKFDNPWGNLLGVASAQAARPSLESNLFSNITTWDFYGGEEYVTARLEANRFRPEIRQVVSSTSTPRRASSAAKGAPETSGFPAANEVPVLSPAALSVINPVEGVTAVQLNLKARGLLTSTGSRGLGWRGQAQLAISGLFGNGTPTVGPAGLGAQ